MSCKSARGLWRGDHSRYSSMRRDGHESSTALGFSAGQRAANLRASHGTVYTLPTGALGHRGGHKDSRGTSVVSKVL